MFTFYLNPEQDEPFAAQLFDPRHYHADLTTQIQRKTVPAMRHVLWRLQVAP